VPFERGDAVQQRRECGQRRVSWAGGQAERRFQSAQAGAQRCHLGRLPRQQCGDRVVVTAGVGRWRMWV
jgi:hypothetical protein